MVPGHKSQHTPFIILPAEHILSVPSAETAKCQLIKKNGRGRDEHWKGIKEQFIMKRQITTGIYMTYNLFHMISCCNGQIHMYTSTVAFPVLSLLQLSTHTQVTGLVQ
jgi:hypothetical protein